MEPTASFPSAAWKFGEHELGIRVQDNMLPTIMKSAPIPYLLLREMAQNSEDGAKSAGGRRATPRLRLTFKTVSVAGLESIGLSQVMEHVGACEQLAGAARPDADGSVDVLLIEDDGRGLEGSYVCEGLAKSPAQKYMYESGSGGGSRSKGGNQGGRHGVGADTATIASSIRLTYFHTTRQDGSSFASGRASLASHVLDGRRFNALGSYSVYDAATRSYGPCVGEAAEAVARTVGFVRPTTESGLSVCVVAPDAAVTFDSLLAAAVSSQFYQIVSGIVAVTIVDERSGRRVDLDGDSLEATLCQPEVREVITRFAKHGTAHYRILADIDDVLAHLRRALAHGAAVDAAYEGGAVRLPEEEKAALADAWSDGRAVGVRVPVPVTNGAEQGVGAVFTCVQRRAEGASGWDVLVRDNITVYQKASGRLSFTFAEGPLAVLLGDCEDPTHMQFHSDLGVTRGWKAPDGAIRAFKKAAGEAHKAVSGVANKVDRAALARFFPLPLPDRSRPAWAGPPREDGVDGIPDTNVPEAAEDAFVIQQIKGENGFSVALSDAGKLAISGDERFGVAISMNYAVMPGRRATGRRVVDTFTVRVQDGAEEFHIGRKDGVVRASGLTAGFALEVVGLDRNRDVAVRTEIVREEAA